MRENSRRGRTARLKLRDHIPPRARVLFVGINPGIRSALTGHHFAGYSNQFWKLLHESRLVPERISYADDGRLPQWGYGITNLVSRASAGINELKSDEYIAGRVCLLRKIRRYRPHVVALVGVTVYRVLFPDAARGPVELGPADQTLESTPVFVLPNPSGRNANFTYREMLSAFRRLRQHIGLLE